MNQRVFIVVICTVLAQLLTAAVNIPTEVPYGQDVENWWSQHVFNPNSPNYDPEIISPANQVTLNPGESINTAVDNLPEEGGTIILNPGTYSSFQIRKRRNIHIIAPDGATITGANSAHGTNLSYHDFVVAIRVNQDPEHVDDFINKKTKNIYIKGITFDGGGSVTDAFSANCAEGVLVENCTIQNIKAHPTYPNHIGTVGGEMGTNNLWWRNCTFKCYTPDPSGWALYHDGVHAGGCIDCFFENGFNEGACLLLVNDDYTYDIDGDNEYEQNEVRKTEYFVIYGCDFKAGLSRGASMSCANCLIMNCTAQGSFLNSFVRINPKSSIIYPQNKYYFYGNKLIGNNVQGGIALLEANNDLDYDQHGNKGQIGRFTIKGNITNGMTYLMQEIGHIDGPSIICGNCFNDPGCTPDPDCDGNDVVLPSKPGAPVADFIDDTSVSLSWTESTDDVIVLGYVIFRDGENYDTTETASYTDEHCDYNTTYTYEVQAYDLGPNYSQMSDPLVVTTLFPNPQGDQDGNCQVDWFDFQLVGLNWQASGADLEGDANFDSIVNGADAAVVAQQWLDNNRFDFIMNGSFENGSNYWNGPYAGGIGEVLNDSTISYSGNYCYHAKGSSSYAYLEQPFNSGTAYNLQPDTTYTVKLMLRLDNPQGGPGVDGGFMTRFVELSPSVVIHPSPWYTLDSEGQWLEVINEFTTTSGYQNGRLDLLWDHTGGSIYMDNVQILICDPELQ